MRPERDLASGTRRPTFGEGRAFSCRLLMPWGPVGARSSACTALSPPSSWCCNEYLLRVPVQTGPLGCTLSLHGGWRPLPQAASGRTVAISQDEGRACGKPPVQGRHEEVPLCPACHRPSSHCVLKATPPPGTRSPGAACDHCAVVSSSSHQCGTPVGICTCPWAHPGFFSVVKIRQGQGAVEALGWLAAEGQAGLGPPWSTRRVLSASREQRGSRPRRLPARPRHGSVVGQNSDLLPVPKASGILRPPPQFPASWPTRPWPSHQGPAALLSFQCAWSLESRKPVPRPCSLCGPGTRLPREAQHEQRKSESESGTAPCPPLQSHLHSPGSGFKVSLRVLGTKGILSRERLGDAVWSLGIEALFFTAVKK